MWDDPGLIAKSIADHASRAAASGAASVAGDETAAASASPEPTAA
jgi:hypothetical protein